MEIMFPSWQNSEIGQIYFQHLFPSFLTSLLLAVIFLKPYTLAVGSECPCGTCWLAYAPNQPLLHKQAPPPAKA